MGCASSTEKKEEKPKTTSAEQAAPTPSWLWGPLDLPKKQSQGILSGIKVGEFKPGVYISQFDEDGLPPNTCIFNRCVTAIHPDGRLLIKARSILNQPHIGAPGTLYVFALEGKVNPDHFKKLTIWNDDGEEIETPVDNGCPEDNDRGLKFEFSRFVWKHFSPDGKLEPRTDGDDEDDKDEDYKREVNEPGLSEIRITRYDEDAPGNYSWLPVVTDTQNETLRDGYAPRFGAQVFVSEEVTEEDLKWPEDLVGTGETAPAVPSFAPSQKVAADDLKGAVFRGKIQDTPINFFISADGTKYHLQIEQYVSNYEEHGEEGDENKIKTADMYSATDLLGEIKSITDFEGDSPVITVQPKRLWRTDTVGGPLFDPEIDKDKDLSEEDPEEIDEIQYAQNGSFMMRVPAARMRWLALDQTAAKITTNEFQIDEAFYQKVYTDESEFNGGAAGGNEGEEEDEEEHKDE